MNGNIFCAPNRNMASTNAVPPPLRCRLPIWLHHSPRPLHTREMVAPPKIAWPRIATSSSSSGWRFSIFRVNQIQKVCGFWLAKKLAQWENLLATPGEAFGNRISSMWQLLLPFAAHCSWIQQLPDRRPCFKGKLHCPLMLRGLLGCGLGWPLCPLPSPGPNSKRHWLASLQHWRGSPNLGFLDAWPSTSIPNLTFGVGLDGEVPDKPLDLVLQQAHVPVCGRVPCYRWQPRALMSCTDSERLCVRVTAPAPIIPAAPKRLFHHFQKILRQFHHKPLTKAAGWLPWLQ